MLTKLVNFVKDHSQDVILALLVALLSLLSFATGYLTARYQERESIQIESPVIYNE
ncbi:MAG: hypothetical protein HY577_01150 [Candidatus Nealsonbacteria bacterium]|nr:hypothetical protein [Candidatus Nealsonbacteria bacterium]